MPTRSEIDEDEGRKAALLAALYDRERGGNAMPSLDRLAEDIGMAANDPAVARLSNELKEAGLIAGKGSWGGGVFRPQLTEAGRRAVAISFQPPQQGGSNISGVSIGGAGHTVSFMQNSPGATQEVSLAPFLQRRVETWLDDLERRGPKQHSSDHDSADIAELAAELRGEIQGQARSGRVRQLVSHLVGILGDQTASLASAGLLEAGEALLHQLTQ
jgi:hypothetical protein